MELQVRRQPIISDSSTQSMVVSEGQSVEFKCFADGFPTPGIKWRKQDSGVLPTGEAIHRYVPRNFVYQVKQCLIINY